MTRHVDLDLYRLVMAGYLPPEALLERIHRHLMQACEDCCFEWTEGRTRTLTDVTSAGLDLPLPAFRAERSIEPLPVQDRLVGYGDLSERARADRRRTRLRRRMREQLATLVAVPPADRTAKIEGSRGRYRSRGFAELLLEESRERVRVDPAEAGNLASLVPVVLRWTPGARGTEWSEELEIRAVAWQANALRVAGDLPGAENLLTGLRAMVLERSLPPKTLAEVTSLEASLRLAQRRLDQAKELLEAARPLFRETQDAEGEARVVLKLAILHLTYGRPEKVLKELEASRRLLDRGATTPYLRLCRLNARLAALCDLGRFDDARSLLHHEVDPPEIADPRGRAVLAHHTARIAWGLGDLVAAERAFLDCQDHYLQGSRTYEAVLVSLDLAQLLLEAGRFGELRDLAADLVVQFQARGVARETLAALRLLAQAAAAREVSRELLDHVRGLLKPERSPVRRGKPL